MWISEGLVGAGGIRHQQVEVSRPRQSHHFDLGRHIILAQHRSRGHIVACLNGYRFFSRIDRSRFGKFTLDLHSGFQVLLRDENRSIDQTLALAEQMLGLKS